MGFTAVDGIFDEDLDYDIGLFKFEKFKDKCRRKNGCISGENYYAE